MKLNFYNNVYLVKGYKKDCIYDLANRKLYHINRELTTLIENCIFQNKINFTKEEINVLKQLKQNKILCESLDSYVHDISEIAVKPKIDFAWIEICTFCNLKCKHCYNESSSECHETMSFQDFCETCEKLVKYGIKKIQLIGGEPFCHKDIRKMLSFASEKFEFIEVFTNGTLLNEKWCDFLKEKNIKIALSVYSYIPEEHDKVTTIIGSYQKTINSIQMLKDRDVKYRIATTHMKNIEIGECNTKLFKINPNKDIIRMAGRGSINLLSPELLRKKLITKSTFSYELNPQRIAVNIAGHQCFSKKIYISANLEVFPCVMERRISHGNLKGHSIEEILDDKILFFNKNKVDECRECEFRYACHDCRPDSLSNNVYDKPYNCTYDVKKGIWLNEDDVIKKFFQMKMIQKQ